MQPIRHLLTALSFAIALWVVASVAGVVFDPIRAGFWSASLMWAFLASLMIAPALVVIYDSSIFSAEQATADSAESAESRAPETPQKSFVEESRAAHVSPESSSDHDDEPLPQWVQERSE